MDSVPEDFAGLKDSAWRSRQALGGALTADLRHQTGQPYQSWGVRRRLELHLAQEKQYDFDNPWPSAKLFVYSHSQELAFGFYLESPGIADTTRDPGEFIHWQNFKERLQRNSAMREALLAAMVNHGLAITDYYQRETGGALGCQFAFRGGHLQWWRPEHPVWEDIEVEHLVRRIAQLPEDKWVDFHVFARIKQAEAIAMKGGVVAPVLRVLRALTPVYEMTITPR